ncbi:MAG: hypothetical protein K1X79_10765 [Oligoflexia bacterium]|nr:hypothetical protein [Oligoflexia bacterium]
MAASPFSIALQSRFGVQGQRRAFWYQYISVILLILCSVIGTLSGRSLQNAQPKVVEVVPPAPLVIRPNLFHSSASAELDSDALQPLVRLLLAHDLSARFELSVPTASALTGTLMQAEALRRGLEAQAIPSTAYEIIVVSSAAMEASGSVAVTLRRQP